MKQNLKQFWRVAVLAVVVLLAGCAKEEFEDQIEQTVLQKKMVNLNDLPMLQQAIAGKRMQLAQLRSANKESAED